VAKFFFRKKFLNNADFFSKETGNLTTYSFLTFKVAILQQNSQQQNFLYEIKEKQKQNKIHLQD